MELKLPKAAAAAVTGGVIQIRPAETADTTDSEFLQFANVGEPIAATAAKLEKVGLLAEYLRALNSEQLPAVATYLTGRAFAQSDLRTFQVGWAVIYRALLAATRISDTEFHRIATSDGDLGKTAFECLVTRTISLPVPL